MVDFLVILFSFFQVIIMSIIIVCGSLLIILACFMLGSELIRRIMLHFHGYETLIDFAWNHNDFKKWLKEKEHEKS